MRNAMETIIGYYTDPGYQLESYFQPAYILLLLAEMFVFWGFFPDFAVLPTIFVGIHVILLYTIGYQKVIWEGNPKEKMYQKVFIFGQILLIISALIANWKLTLICLGIQVGILLLVFALLFIAGTLNCTCANEDKIEQFIHKFSIFFFILIMCVPAITFIVTLFLLPINVIAQIGILLALILLIPYIAELDDEGVNLFQVTFETL